MSRFTVAAAAVAAALVLSLGVTACSSAEQQPDPDPNSDTNTEPAVTVTATATETQVVEGGGGTEMLIYSYGDAAMLTDALEVKVSTPVELGVLPGFEEWDFDRYVSVPVTISNIGEEPVTIGAVSVIGMSVDGSDVAPFLADGIDDNPGILLMPGKSVEFSSGMAMYEWGSPLTVQVQSFTTGETVFYT